MQLQNLLNNIAKLSHAQQLLKVVFWILWNTQWYICICRYIYVAGNVVDEKKQCINESWGYRVRRKRRNILVLFNLQQQDYRNLAVHWIFIIFLLQRIFSNMYSDTPCPNTLVRCSSVASPVDKFAEIDFPVQNYASPTNKWISFLPGHKEDFFPMIFGKLDDSHWNRVFSAWSFRLILQLGSIDFLLRVPRCKRDIWFL